MSRKGLQVLTLNAMSPIVLRVREARLRRGWTQGELARRAGVRRATINSLESGRRQRVNLGVLEKVAKALGVPVLRLLREQR
jgi:transcriptional regulator with XRE-family HTH domain